MLMIPGCCLWLALPVAALAQPADPQSAPQAPASSTAPDESRSLFDPTWHQFQFGGRATSIDGDPARFQRYQDVRDGVLFTDAKYAREATGGDWLYRVTADNVGYYDQRYTGVYERTGRFVISGMWDEIPQFYSVDTKTPYTMTGSPLRLDDVTQQLIQNGAPQKLNLYVPISPQFDLRERRDIGTFSVVATPTPQLDVKGTFTTTRHNGELPWGGSFGFSNDVEVAQPYDSRTNDLSIGTEWTNTRSMLRVAYDGSWFNNLDPTLVWDSPLRLTDSASSGPGSGQMNLWPTNNAQTISGAGYAKFPHRTQVTGAISYGFWNNNEPLLPFTINSALPQIALPRATADAGAHVFSLNANLVTRPLPDWDFTARVREYHYSNQMPATTITNYVSYDTSVNQSLTNGPELYAHSRTNVEGDATYTGLKPFGLTAGFARNETGYDARIFESTTENVLRLSADAVGSQWTTFHAKYEYGHRTGTGLNEDLLVQIGEQPDMRHYDLANRNRNQLTAIVDMVPNDQWTFSVSGGLGKDSYPDSYFGLQETTFRTFSAGADFHLPNGFGGGGTYNFERYGGLQQSRSADSSTFDDPQRNWTSDTAETVNYFSLYATPPKFGPNTEARVSYDFSYAEGSYLYTVVAGGPLPAPSQLPNVYNKLQQLHIDVRHRLTTKLAATFSYLYEPFRVYDFAFDPSVVNGIVQPSSLVLGYVYRPYTANSFQFGVRYLF
ncbi:MAG TPA: MtrB/PioB family outer membrane beta-barrel protein [Vicinamibacterales bacterium]|nr:MtrB/PioB family outer membrane beta-barrel protein [Vicinamibacterales bacterium]